MQTRFLNVPPLEKPRGNGLSPIDFTSRVTFIIFTFTVLVVIVLLGAEKRVAALLFDLSAWCNLDSIESIHHKTRLRNVFIKFYNLLMPSTSFPTDPLENWSDLRVQLIWAYDGPVNEYRRVAYPAQPIAAWFIRRGRVTLTFGSDRETFGSNRWIFPRAKDGWQEFSDDAEILSIRFIARWPTGESLFDRPQSISMPAAKLPQLTRIGERMARFIRRNFPGVTVGLPLANRSLPEQHFGIQRLLYSWMLEYTAIMRQEGLVPNAIGHLDRRVRHAIHLLEAQTLNFPLREQKLAQGSGLSVPQLNRLFVRDVGKTPVEYWEERRVQAARLALFETQNSIKSIAYDLGFGSSSHFSTWTKKKFGKSPRQLRKHPS